MTRNSKLYARQKPGHRTDVNEYSLSRTPVADEAGGGPQSPAMAKHRNQLMKHLYIDPGDVHVGMAEFTLTGLNTWACTNTWEVDANLGEEQLARFFHRGTYALIGYERFRLFGHLAQQQTGSEFRTSQLIGVLKYLHRTQNPHGVVLLVQDPNVQRVAERLAKSRGVPLHSVKTRQGGHAKSAELHGIFNLCRDGVTLVSALTDRIKT